VCRLCLKQRILDYKDKDWFDKATRFPKMYRQNVSFVEICKLIVCLARRLNSMHTIRVCIMNNTIRFIVYVRYHITPKYASLKLYT